MTSFEDSLRDRIDAAAGEGLVNDNLVQPEAIDSSDGFDFDDWTRLKDATLELIRADGRSFASVMRERRIEPAHRLVISTRKKRKREPPSLGVWALTTAHSEGRANTREKGGYSPIQLWDEVVVHSGIAVDDEGHFWFYKDTPRVIGAGNDIGMSSYNEPTQQIDRSVRCSSTRHVLRDPLMTGGHSDPTELVDRAGFDLDHQIEPQQQPIIGWYRELLAEAATAWL